MEKFDINGLDFRTLRLMVDIARLGSVSAAAEKRHITQSTASYALEKLRHAFHDPIFVRAGRGMIPTLRGQEIVEECAAILGRMDDLASQNMFDPAQARREFVIAATGFETGVLVGPLIQQMGHEAPACRIALPGLDLSRIAEKLEKEWDIALVATVPDNPNLKITRLFEASYKVYYDPTARSAPTDLEAYCQARHAVATLGRKAVTDIDTALAKLGRQRFVALTVAQFEALAVMMRGTDMISTLVEGMQTSTMSGFKTVPAPIDLPLLSIRMVWHVRKHEDRGHQWLRQQIKEIAADIEMAGNKQVQTQGFR